MKKFLWKIFSSYFSGELLTIRANGWFACENMVLTRMEKAYPEKYEEMKMELLA